MISARHPPITIPVKSLISHGDTVGEQHTYFPIADEFLRPGCQLAFDVYVRDQSDMLVLGMKKGDCVDADIQEFIRKGNYKNRLYVRGDERPALIDHEESVLLEVLDDGALPVEQKCVALQQVTVLLSQQMDRDPCSANIARAKNNINRLVDFSLKQRSALKGLVRLVDHDYYTYTHSVNVGLYALTIAMAHYGGKIGHNLHEIASAFFLHDIGKCRIRPEIINKPGPLDDAEWEEMRRHPDYGQHILARENLLSQEAQIVIAQHHERPDGKGYPKGLSGKHIHPYARICSIADAFDAMTTRRSYRDPQTAFESLKAMKEAIGEQFDSTFYRIFVLQLRQGRQRESRLQIVT